MQKNMRKTLTIIALSLITALGTAQEETTPVQQSAYTAAPVQEVKPVYLGFLARPSMTWLNSQNRELDSKGVRAGFSFGFLVDLTLGGNENYAIGTGLMMNLVDGGSLRFDDVRERSSSTSLEQAYTDVNLNFQWLEVPLTLKLKTNQVGYMRYFGQLGLQGGINLGANQSGEYQFDEIPRNVVLIDKDNINDETQLFNAGMLVGLGAEYNISGNTNIVFGISYYQGFTNVLKGDVYNTRNGDVLFEDIELGEGETISAPSTGGKRRATLSNIALNVGVVF